MKAPLVKTAFIGQDESVNWKRGEQSHATWYWQNKVIIPCLLLFFSPFTKKHMAVRNAHAILPGASQACLRLNAMYSLRRYALPECNVPDLCRYAVSECVDEGIYGWC